MLSLKLFEYKLFYMIELRASIKFFVLLSLYFTILFGSCTSSQVEEQPRLSFSKMSEVLADVHIMEGELQGINTTEKDSVASLYYYYIFKLNNVNQEDFYQSLDYYTSHPELYEELYSATADSISKKPVMTN